MSWTTWLRSDRERVSPGVPVHYRIEATNDRVIELDSKYPELRLNDFFARLKANFEEQSFTPLDDIWEDSLRKLGDEFFPSEDDEE